MSHIPARWLHCLLAMSLARSKQKPGPWLAHRLQDVNY
uniref:Uncharacterized protein n=1 Tax=Arundo donax TaxID=35708 RepID=A0A0A8Y5U5_ARUDO